MLFLELFSKSMFYHYSRKDFKLEDKLMSLAMYHNKLLQLQLRAGQAATVNTAIKQCFSLKLGMALKR